MFPFSSFTCRFYKLLFITRFTTILEIRKNGKICPFWTALITDRWSFSSNNLNRPILFVNRYKQATWLNQASLLSLTSRIAFSRLKRNGNIIFLGSTKADRLPIFSFLIIHPKTGKMLHHNFIAVLLNDLYGIQARGGCACAGPYSQASFIQGNEEYKYTNNTHQ